eukprot:7610299-Alexandrium_andersonii.AAC.1
MAEYGRSPCAPRPLRKGRCLQEARRQVHRLEGRRPVAERFRCPTRAPPCRAKASLSCPSNPDIR